MLSAKTERLLLLLILVVCASVGLAAAIGFELSPFGSYPALDEESYVSWGLRIAGGDWFGSQVFYQEPLYPYFLGVVFKLTNQSLIAARLLQVAISTGTAWLIFTLGKRLFSAPVGLLSASLYVFIAVVHLYSAELIKETLATHFAAWLCVVGVSATERPRTRTFGLLGLLYGCLMLLRGNFVAMLPLLGVWALVTTLNTRKWLLVVALAVGLAVPLLPVAARNHAISGEWIITTSQGGQNFFIGNSEYATGMYAPIDWVRATPQFEALDFQREAERRVGHALRPGEVSQFWFKESFAFLTADVPRAAALSFRKVLLFVHAYEIPDNYSLTCMRQQFIPIFWLLPLGVGWLVAPALLGLFIHRRERRLWFPAGLMLTYALSVIAFFVVSRYRMPIVPPMCVLAAAAVSSLRDFYRQGRRRELTAGCTALFVGLGVSAWPLPFLMTGEQLEAQCHSAIGVTVSALGKPDQALPYLERALSLAPENPEFAYNLGVAYQQLGSLDAALAQYEQTLRVKPHHAQAAFNAGLIALSKNDAVQAKQLFLRARDNGLATTQLQQALERAENQAR